MDAHQKSKLRRHTRSHLSEKFFSSILKTQGKKIRTFFVKILGNNSREKINLKTIRKQSRIFLNKVINAESFGKNGFESSIFIESNFDVFRCSFTFMRSSSFHNGW